MSKILLINGHPTPETSLANAGIVRAFTARRPDVTVRMLAELTKTENGRLTFDMKAEQEALVKADVIVLQFPFYWYGYPALLKTWIDDVFTHGFAHGSTGTALYGKRIVFSFTAGAPETLYVEGGPMGWSMEAFLPPMLQLANLCGMQALQPVWSCGMTYIPGIQGDKAEILARTEDHAARLLVAIDAA